MDYTQHKSPQLQAIDLLRFKLENLSEHDLNAHAGEVLATIAELNDYINSSAAKSANSLLNATQLTRKLCLHIARVRDLIQSAQLAAAFYASAGQTPLAAAIAPTKRTKGKSSKTGTR